MLGSLLVERIMEGVGPLDQGGCKGHLEAAEGEVDRVGTLKERTKTGEVDKGTRPARVRDSDGGGVDGLTTGRGDVEDDSPEFDLPLASGPRGSPPPKRQKFRKKNQADIDEVDGEGLDCKWVARWCWE